MKIRFFLTIIIMCASIGLNASFISAISGVDTSSDTYKLTKERGIIVTQDVDGDGIHDSEDDCLTTDICNGKNCKKQIVAKAEIKDSDNDMVLDNVDNCLNTPKGFKVDENGCSIEVNLNVIFDSGEAIIKENFTGNVNELINFLEQHVNYSVIIEGHTDNVGSPEDNMTLSKNRANSVKIYMINNSKIEESRISLKWFGEEKPLNDNLTNEEQSQNRRVIAILNK